MTTIEELSQREKEELQLVREKYAKLRGMVPHVCERKSVEAPHDVFGMVRWVYGECKHCGADMAAKEESR